MTRFLIRLDALMHVFRWAPILVLVGMVLSLGWFAMDREPPFKMLTVHKAAVKAGHTATLRATVERQTWRKCSADMSRFILDAQGDRLDLGSSHVSAEMIDQLERENPGELRLQVPIPADFDAGPAVLVSVLSYRCNRVHTWWPIVVTTHLPFEVVP